MNHPTIVPFIKWAGGKRQLIKELKKRMPKTYKTYYEPFVGGGALFFHLQPKKAVISDLNKELMDTYKAIRQDVYRVRENLLLMEYGHHTLTVYNEDKNIYKPKSPLYEKIRSIDQYEFFEGRKLNMKDSIYLRAARFIYLNKNGFNGLYRVNRSGFFNVPSKHKNEQPTFNWDDLLVVSRYLKTIPYNNLKNKSFYWIREVAQKGDFIYFDPPYDYEIGTKGFSAYQKDSFGQGQQKALATICILLDSVGVKWMVSNHNTKLINELFKGYNIDVVSARRMVGGKNASRNNVEEVIITNYDYKK